MTVQPLMSFDPKGNETGFRTALGSFATGVTLITTDSPEGPVGIVANSFTSVSLDPPLVLWCPAKSSRRFEHFAGSRRFAIHVLAEDQRNTAEAFSKSKTAFESIPHHKSHCGMPLIDNALATLECSLHSDHDAGDHLIIVGEVTKCHRREGNPLIYFNGQYGAL